MAEQKKILVTEGQKKAAAFAARPLKLEPKPAKMLRAEQQAEEKGRVQAAARAVANDIVGTRMPDGTVYAGLSPDTGAPMYVMAEDTTGTMDFTAATEHTVNLKAHGHQDWHLPTKGELSVLFSNRAAIGGFREDGRLTAPLSGWYWSSKTDYYNCAWAQNFGNGKQVGSSWRNHHSVRFVR